MKKFWRMLKAKFARKKPEVRYVDLSTRSPKHCPHCQSTNFFLSSTGDHYRCKSCWGFWAKLRPSQLLLKVYDDVP